MDPQALHTAGKRLAALNIADRVELFDDAYEAARGADALLLATEWQEFRTPEIDRLHEIMRGRHIFDGRNILVQAEVEEAGFVYRGIGRPARSGRA